jgi:hypothetical protein
MKLSSESKFSYATLCLLLSVTEDVKSVSVVGPVSALTNSRILLYRKRENERGKALKYVTTPWL